MIGRPDGSVLRILLVLLMMTFSLASLPGLLGMRINTTDSIPKGFYIVSTDKHAPLVEFCPEGLFSQISIERGYRPAGVCPDGAAPLIKPVIAQPGDIVSISGEGIQINGSLLPNTRPKSFDTAGKPLPAWRPGSYVVAPATVWVASTYHPSSFDSRYFGPVSVRAIRHWLKPLWVLGSAPIAR